MSDTSKRRARKSKLVPRDYVEIENEKNIKMQEPPIKTAKIIIKSFENQGPESSIQFDVQVEVESCDDGDNLIIDESFNGTDRKENDNIEDSDDWAIREISKTCKESILAKAIASNDDGESLTEYMKFLTARSSDVLKLTDDKIVNPTVNSNINVDKLSSKVKATSDKTTYATGDIKSSDNIANISPSVVFKVTEDEIIKATNDIQKKSDNIADKILCIEVKNILGRFRHVPHVRDKHDDLIQDALESWMKWIYSKANDPPLFYKCYLCKMAWWNLSDFREHIRNHNSITLNVDIEALGEQCCIIAYIEKPHGNIKFSLESDCWRCGKNFDSHLKSYYECRGCTVRFKTCLSLAEHESFCSSYWYINNYEQPAVNLHLCTICHKRSFFNAGSLMKHLIQYHAVRTDRCTLSKTATCIKCNEKYVTFLAHICRSKSGRMFCDNCDQRLCSKMMIDIHDSLSRNVRCKICDTLLETECMKAAHMLTHSSNFALVYKCVVCYDNVLFRDLNADAIREHSKLVHTLKKTDKRVRSYDSIIIPAKFIEELPKVPEINNQTEKKVDSKKQTRRNTRKKLPFIFDKVNEIVHKPIPDNRLSSATHIPDNNTQESINRLSVTDIPDNNTQETISRLSVTHIPDNNTQETINRLSVTHIPDNNTQESINRLSVTDLPDNNTQETINKLSVKHIPDNNTQKIIYRLSATHVPDKKSQKTATYTAISKTGEVIKTRDSRCKITIGEIFSNFNDEIQDDKNIKVQFENTTAVNTYTIPCKNSDKNELSNNVELTNDIIDNVISNTDVVIKKEIITDDNSMIHEKTQEINNIDNIIENAQVNNSIKKEIMSDNEASELTTENNENKINEDTIHSDIQIKQEILDPEDCEDHGNYEIKIEESDVSLSKVFRVSDHLKELTSKMIIKEEFDENMLKNAQFEDLDESNMFEPEVIISNKNKSMNPVIYCGSCDFKGTLDQFKNHETFCDSPEPRTYRRLKVYTCLSCEFEGTHAEFKKHKDDCYHPKKVKLDELHYCSKCKKNFQSMRLYLIHLSVHGVGKKSCPECGMQFEQNTSLKHHVNEHIKDSFLTVRLIKKEMSWKIKMYQCKLCRAKFKSKDFFSHWERHLVFKDASSTSTESSVRKAEEKISVNDTKVLAPDVLKTVLEFLQNKRRVISKVCMLCDRFFDRKNGVKRHLVEHLLNDALLNKYKCGALVCQICGDMFLGSTQYKSHMRDHADLPVYKCEMCNKCFSDSSNFTKHKKVHNISVLVCDLCKKKFHVKETLIKHIKMHDLSRPQICLLCKTKKTFYDNTAFRRHMRNYHNRGALKYTCHICKEAHGSLKEKWDHLWLVHKERKNISDCPVCGESFRRYIDVKKHTQLMHKDEWSRYCKSFRSIFEMKNKFVNVLKDSSIQIKSNETNETLVVYE